MAGEKRNVVAYFSTQGWNEVKADLQGLGDKGQQVFDRIAKAAKGVDAPMKGVNAATREFKGALSDMAGGAGRLGNVITALGPKWIGLGAAIGGTVLAVKHGIDAFAKEERAVLRLDAVLRATGDTAGLTRDQLSALAESLERSTFFKKDDILQAEAALATFKAVSGDAFSSTIKLALDLSEVMGGDVVSNARLLGKALQDPADGLDMLKRKIGEFSPETARAAEELANAGKHAEAVNLIIGELQQKMGGAATAAASGYAGAVDNLDDSWEDLLKTIGEVAADKSGLTAFLNGVGNTIDGLNHKLNLFLDNLGKLSDVDVIGKIADTTLKQKELQAELNRLEATGGNVAFRDHNRESAIRREIGELDKQRAEYQAEIDKRSTALKVARAAQDAAAKEQEKRTKTTNKGLEEQTKHTKATAAATKDIVQQQKQAADAAAELASRQREAISQPLEHAYERMQDLAADWLSGQEINADSFVGIWKKAAAEIASALIFRPIFQSTFGSLLPGISGSLTGGAGGAGGAASGLSLLSGYSGLSSGLSGLLNGFSTPIINPGIAFDIGSYLGLGANTVGTLHTALANFTPLSSLASFGGNMLGNLLLGNRGVGASIGGTIGGIAGSFFGPVGSVAGSFLGNAIGGLFGGGGASSKLQEGTIDLSTGAVLQRGGLTGSKFSQENRDAADAMMAAAQAISGAIFKATGKTMTGSLRTGVSDRYGYTLDFFDAQGGRTPLDKNFSNPDDAIGYIAETIAGQIGTTLPDYLRDALNRIDFNDVQQGLAQLSATLGYRQSLLDLADSLKSNAATTNLAPEAYYQLIRQQSQDIFARGAKGEASLDEIAAATAAFLDASQGYAGRASSLYAADLSGTQAQLRSLANVAPKFAAGGEFSPGVFVTHPNEIVMTSSTPGRVYNARETQQMLGGSGEVVRAIEQQNTAVAMQTMQLRQELQLVREELAAMRGYMFRQSVA